MIAFLAKPLVRSLLMPAIGIALAAGYTFATFYAGYDYSAKATKAKLAEQYSQQLSDLYQQRIDDQLELGRLQSRLSKDVRKIQTITKEIPIYVAPDKDEFCGPPVGVVGLLNNARDPELSFTPDQPDDASRAPSGIGYTEQVADTLGITGRYNELMLRHNALLRWMQKNYGTNLEIAQ
jgi:hypothetical protein